MYSLCLMSLIDYSVSQSISVSEMDVICLHSLIIFLRPGSMLSLICPPYKRLLCSLLDSFLNIDISVYFYRVQTWLHGKMTTCRVSIHLWSEKQRRNTFLSQEPGVRCTRRLCLHLSLECLSVRLQSKLNNRQLTC